MTKWLRALFGFLPVICCAQVPAQTLSGEVKDSLTRAPVPLATVSVGRRGQDTALRMTITDEKGRFKLANIPAGSFAMTLSSFGYISRTWTITVAADAGVVNLDSLYLTPRSEILQDVVVDGKRTLIEERLDRTVYNVERDKSLTGGDATDALRRVPMLSVDMDGNVTLRGSSNIKVLINNKPSTITAANLADALKQIPADQIRSVEVITSPSVKYDADGSAGIVNIVLKQDRLHGMLIDPDMAVGTRASFLGLTGAYNNKKMSFSIGGFGRATYNVTGVYSNLQTVGQQAIGQVASTKRNELTDNYNAGWEYDLDSNDFFNASLRFSQLDTHNDQLHLVSNFYTGTVADSAELQQVGTVGRSGTVDAAVNFTHAFGRSQREWSLLTLFSRTDGSSGFTSARDDPGTGALIGQVRNADRSSNQEITVQVDDETPLDSNQLIGFGAKYIIRRVISDYSYATAAESEPFTGERSPGLTNRFTYDQVVTAAYLEYTLNTRTPLSLRTGLRYEYTAIHAGLATAGSALPGISPYGALVPAVNLGWRLGNGNMVRLGITRRIQRPSIQYLNPNEFAPAPGSLSMGNPALGPEFADNIELGYTTAIGSLTIGMSAFYRHTTGAIESVSFPSASGDTIERTYANIGTERSGGLDVYSNLDQGRKLSLSGGADIYYAKLDGGSGPGAGGSSGPGAGGFSASGAGGRNSGWVVTGRLSGGYRFVKGWSLYLYSYYRGSRVLLQGFQSGYPYYSLTLKRDLAKGRGTIGLGAENFLSKAIRVTTKINSGALTESTTNLSHTLSLRVYMSLVLGRLRVVRKERQKKSVTNDDLKAG